MYPILFIDLLKQSSYKNVMLLSVMHKQLTYFSKKYSKSNKIVLNITNKSSISYKKSSTETMRTYVPNNLLSVFERNNIKAIKYIYKKVHLIEDHNNFVFKSVKFDNIKIIRYFLNNKSRTLKKIVCCSNNYLTLHYYNYKTYTVFSFACKKGSFKIVKLLLAYGVNIHENNCRHGFRLSAEKGHNKIVKLLLNSGIDINTCDDYSLRLGARNGHTKVVKMLLNAGADIHARDDYALRFSAKNGYAKIVKLLLNAGANIQIFDNYVFICKLKNNSTTIKLLLNIGANVFDYVILQNYAKRGNIEIAKLLLGLNENVSMINLKIVSQYIKVFFKKLK